MTKMVMIMLLLMVTKMVINALTYDDQDGDDNALTYGDQDGDDNAYTYDDDDCDLPVTPPAPCLVNICVLLDVITSCPHAIARPL